MVGIWERLGLTDEQRAAVMVFEADRLIALHPHNLKLRNLACIIRGHASLAAQGDHEIPWAYLHGVAERMKDEHRVRRHADVQRLKRRGRAILRQSMRAKAA